MKKKFTNGEIEQILAVINNPENFIFTAKMPVTMRHAIRVNRKALMERMQIYQDERNEIFNEYIKNGFAQKVEDTLHVEEEYRAPLVQELKELASVPNELDLEMVDRDILQAFLDTHDLTMAEEDALLLFDE